MKMTPTLPDNWFPQPDPLAASQQRNDNVKQPKPCKDYDAIIDKIIRLDPIPLMRCPKFKVVHKHEEV